ncbi:hypothetical protein HCU01_01120 [Halomonas cupida]|uniref:Cytochrome oxidase Cu insertion factor, SCO1/SenC/PrrC family n=1 Tax=Halomonas cupida TaxID=44933 RepID=A0A1M7B2W7_9GAMM|nr:hypothetical protein [Halomonas cupida]GEN22163.1 hypothetical protein HCU01_01120 [Halomonas cupida]SHL49236.1 hypothetical protein SAMN05660971_00738 [Halomonas cupida]
MIVSARVKLLALMAIFALPMVVAWAMVTLQWGIPEGRTAHGNLDVELPMLGEWPIDQFHKEDASDWVIVYDCGQQCTEDADRWWRLHRALGREAHRLSRVRIGGDGDALPGEHVAHWQQQPDWTTDGRVWIGDPEGMVMLEYPSNIETALVLDDIEKLFKMNPEPEFSPLDESSRALSVEPAEETRHES